MAAVIVLVAWKSTTTVSGERSAMIPSTTSRQQSRATVSASGKHCVFQLSQATNCNLPTDERDSGVTKVGVTRGGNRGCHPYFS